MRQVLFPLVLFLVAFYVWTLPINNLPFGEGDAAWHFGIGDYIVANDRTIDRLPTYIGYWYYVFNPKLGPHALEYPPSNHINYAIMESFGGAKYASVYIYKAITSFIGALAVYFLISYLYGNITGFVAGLGMIFSFREIMTYMWGQQPTLISIVIVPVAIYAFYRYFTSLFEGKSNDIYLYMFSLLVASQYLLHIQGLFVTLVIVALFAAVLMIKERKALIERRILFKSIWKHLAVCLVFLAVVALPFKDIYLGVDETPAPDAYKRGFSEIFSWDIEPKADSSHPQEYLSFANNYSFFLLPFVVAGIIYLLLRRKPQDLLLLAWLFAMYLSLHLDVFLFQLGIDGPRVARMLVAEPQLMFSLAAIGALALPSMFRLPNREAMKLGLSAILVLVILIFLAVPSYGILGSSYDGMVLGQVYYSGIGRVSQEQVNAAEWIASSLPDSAVVRNFGTLGYNRMRFMHVISRHFMHNKESGFKAVNNYGYPNVTLTPTHYLFDYSDYARIGQQAQQAASELSGIESLVNGTKVYDKGNIRIYEVENG